MFFFYLPLGGIKKTMSFIAKLRDPNNGFAGTNLQHCRLFSFIAVVTLLFIFAPAVANDANIYYLDAVNGDDSYFRAS